MRRLAIILGILLLAAAYWGRMRADMERTAWVQESGLFPENAIPFTDSDGQQWVVISDEAARRGTLRLRFTEEDNAPFGREHDWSSSVMWLIRGTGWILGEAPGVEQRFRIAEAAFWVNPIVCLLTGLLLLPAIARLIGWPWALGCAWLLFANAEIMNVLAPLRPDHHGILLFAALACATGFSGMIFGWHAKTALALAVGGCVMGMWVSAVSQIPVLVILGIAICVAGRLNKERNDEIAASLRRWGWLSAIGSLAFWLVEYAGVPFRLRFEVNSPLYCLCLAAAGQILCAIVAGRLPQQPRDRMLLMLSFAVVLLTGCAFVFGGSAYFSMSDPFAKQFHMGIIELTPMANTPSDLLGAIPAVLAAFVAAVFVFRRLAVAPADATAWFVLIILGGSIVLCGSAARWLPVSCVLAASAFVTLFLGETHSVRRSVLSGLFFLSGTALFWNARAQALVRTELPDPAIARLAGLEAIAAPIRQWQSAHQQKAILLMPPDDATTVAYLSGCRTVSRVYWEGFSGIQETGVALADPSLKSLEALVAKRRITHVSVPTDRRERLASALPALNWSGKFANRTLGSDRLAEGKPLGFARPVPTRSTTHVLFETRFAEQPPSAMEVMAPPAD